MQQGNAFLAGVLRIAARLLLRRVDRSGFGEGGFTDSPDTRQIPALPGEHFISRGKAECRERRERRDIEGKA